MPDMHQAILILRGAADLVGRSLFPLADAAEAIGIAWTAQAFKAARYARDKVLPDADMLLWSINKFKYSRRATHRMECERDMARLRIAYLEAAQRLAFH